MMPSSWPTTQLQDERFVLLTEMDRRRMVCVSENQTIIIRLKGNASTGSAWRTVRQIGDSVRTVRDWTYTQDGDVPPGFTGGGGHFELYLEAQRPGFTALFLTYDRPFDPQPGYTYKILFHVSI